MMVAVHSFADDDDGKRYWKNTVVVHSHHCHHLHHCSDQTRMDQQVYGGLKEAEVEAVRIDSCHSRGGVGMKVRVTREDGEHLAHHTQVFSWVESGDSTNVAVEQEARMEVCHGIYCLHHQGIPMYDGLMDDVRIQLCCCHSHHIDPHENIGTHSNHHVLSVAVVDADGVDETMAAHNLSKAEAADNDRRMETQNIRHVRGSCKTRTETAAGAVDTDGVFQPRRSEA